MNGLERFARTAGFGFIAVCVSQAGTLTHTARADVGTPDTPAITQFHVVSDGEIYRGGRPGDQGLMDLAAMGVKTDLDLENDDEVVASEGEWASVLGMRFVSHPMSGFWEPHDEVVNAALAILADPSYYPVFVHCQHGQDRTGVIVGLHRVFSDHWTPEAAYQEMREIGFHPELFLLKHYFDERVGL